MSELREKVANAIFDAIADKDNELPSAKGCRNAADAVIAIIIEEAARVAEDADYWVDIAAAIRALK